MFTATVVLALALLDQDAQSAAQETEHAQAAAQETQQPPDPQEQKAEAKEPPTPPHTGIRALFGNLGEDIKHLPAMQNVYIAAIGGGARAAVHPVDQSVQRAAAQPRRRRQRGIRARQISRRHARAGRALDRDVRLRAALRPAEGGAPRMDLLQAQILTELLVEPIKFATRRSGPTAATTSRFRQDTRR